MVSEACEPPPCMGAVCACAGGGFSGSAGPLLAPTCIPYLEPCNNGNDLCSTCYGEAGCAGGSKSAGGSNEPHTCERKNGKIECREGDHRG